MPMAMMPWIEVWRTMFVRFRKVRNAGDRSDRAITMARKPRKMPYFFKPEVK